MGRLLVATLLVLSLACAGRRPPPTVPPVPTTGMVEQGEGSWYGLEERGRPTASGEILDPERFTAAHKSLPFGTVVRVDDLDTGRSVVVLINDRGPHVAGRIIDLSYGAARALGMVERGTARVRLQVLGQNTTADSYTWRVQVGAFVEEMRASSLARELEEARYNPVRVHAQEQAGTIFFKVWVGSFRRRDDADRMADELRRKGKHAVVISTLSDKALSESKRQN